jgi:hypothetical protein
MNPLEALKEKLKTKPEVQHNIGVRVVVGETGDMSKLKPMITADKDDGDRAEKLLERIKRKKLSIVTKKFQEEESKEIPISKAPQKEMEIIQKPKPKKIVKQLVFLEEEKEEPTEKLPEGGPRVEDLQEQEEKEGKEEDEEDQEIQIEIKPPKKRITKKITRGVIPLGTEIMVQIGDTTLAKRLPPLPTYDLKASSYYMNNREIFVNFINGLFETYKDDLLDETKEITCEDIGKDTGNIGLLTHQKIVRDYINLYTPYRGLLLYHGLGAGKTCSSIAIAEGLKNARKVIIMTPASLKRNYMEELKKCGDLIFRKNQFWEWVSTDNNPELLDSLSGALGLSIEYIKRNRGAWLVNVTKQSNYIDLTSSDKKVLNGQLDEMIKNKYTFINYNGLRRDKFSQLTNNFENNIFDNSVVVIDEAHNLISRIVNKINKSSTKMRGQDSYIPQSLSLILYEFLLRANNCRVVLLTGTPIINYPNEIGILFNILRGYIKTWNFTLNVETNKKVSKEILQQMLSNDKIMDYIDYVPSSKIMTITRNPFGFENKITSSSGYKGVTTEKKEKRNREGVVERDQQGNVVYEERGQLTDADFIQRIVKLLKKNDITAIPKGTSYTVNTALPDNIDEFVGMFINTENGTIQNTDKFKRRIIGLTSYFRSAQEELLPVYDKNFNKHIIEIPMSNYQFKVYEEYRHDERTSELKPKNPLVDANGLFKETSSTYRIFSRLACNFVMPKPPGRPNPLVYAMAAAEKKVKANVPEPVDAVEVAEEKPVQPQIPIAIPKMTKNVEAKAQKEREKAEAKAQKEREKAEAKAQKDREKAEAKAQKEREKAEAKAQKDREKAAKKALKGGADTESDDDSESDDDIDIIDIPFVEETDVIVGGSSPNPAEEFINSQEEDKAIDIQEYKDTDANLRDADELEGDEILEKMGNIEYRDAIKASMRYLKLHSQEYLTPEGLETYSPKFLAMLENIEDATHQGLHLIYSQFRSMEGIGIFCLVLEANGFAKFKIKRTSAGGWEMDMSEEDMGKPCYALYTGTEDAEEREILRNIYNGTWDYIPNNIAMQLREKSSNNNLGEIVKVLMITAAGSEGINLRNTRYVHIMEPYWHPVRVEQVIGRARRICSHQGLPRELQTVEVFVYIMIFTKEQLDSEFATELKLHDLSKNSPYIPQSSDQKLLEISNIKEELTGQLLKAIKETSIDCATHSRSNTKEGLVCLSFGQPTVNDFSYNPNYSQDENDAVADINRVTIDWEAREFKLPNGKKYVLRIDTKQVYDYESVMQAKQIPGVRPILIGKLVKKPTGEYEIVKERI